MFMSLNFWNSSNFVKKYEDIMKDDSIFEKTQKLNLESLPLYFTFSLSYSSKVFLSK